MALSNSHRMGHQLWKYRIVSRKVICKRMSTTFVTKDNSQKKLHLNGRLPPLASQRASLLYQKNSSHTGSYIALKEFYHPLGANHHKNLAVNVLNSLSYTNMEKLNSHQIIQLIQSLVEAQYTYLHMNITWLQDDIRLAKHQMQLMECDESVMEPILTHPSFMTLKNLVAQNLQIFNADETSQVLLCMYCLSLQPEDPLVMQLMQQCYLKLDENSLKGLADFTHSMSFLPRSLLFLAKPFIKQANKCLDGLKDDASDLNVTHLVSVMGIVAGLAPVDLWEKALDKTWQFLETKGDSVNSVTVLSTVKLISKASFHIKENSKEKVVNILDRSCIAIQSKLSTLKLSETGLCAKYLAKCNAYNSEMRISLLARAQELLSSETRINDILLSLNTLMNTTPVEIKNQFVEAVMNTNQDIDVFHLCNVAMTCQLAGITNEDIILKCQREIAENVAKILKSEAVTSKVVRFLIFNKFIDKGHEMKFVATLLDSLNERHGVSNFRNTTLVSFLLCHAETCMSDDIFNKMLASIPIWTPNAIYIFLCGLNKMKKPMPWSLRKQVSFIQEYLYSFLASKVKLLNDIPCLHKIYIGLGHAASRRQDPALTDIVLDQICKAASSSTLDEHNIRRVLSALARKRTPYKPEICDILTCQMLNFKHDSISHEKLLNMKLLARVCELMGHQPASLDGFVNMCTDVLGYLLDTDLVGAMGLLLSLATLEVYPEEALSRIFTMEFMELVDNIESENEKAGKYLQNSISLLNRDVVLECPQLNVPWFSEMFFNEKYSLQSQKKYHLLADVYDDVSNALEAALGGRQFLKQNTFSPYYHNIDFQLALNQNKIPVNMESFEKTFPLCQKTSVAVLFQRESEFCYNSKHLKGYEMKKIRQLEIQGYKVIQVPHYEWFSMAHTNWKEKVNYLSDMIFS